MRRYVLAVSTVVALGLAISATGCESDSSSTGTPLVPGIGVVVDGGSGSGSDGGGVAPTPTGVVANTILGLTSKGSIVRIGLGADGTDEDLGFPKFNGTELRSVGAIAKGGAGLYGLDYGAKSGSNVVMIDLPGLNATPMGADIDFRARMPEKEGLAFGGGTLYGSDQFGPVVALKLDGVQDAYILRQANSVSDDTQCTTPEDLVWSGGLLAAGSCASATDSEKSGYWVWEYLFGLPGTSGQGGTLTDKSMRYRSPERILGLGEGAGGLVAASAQGNLLALSVSSFVVVRKLNVTIVDLE